MISGILAAIPSPGEENALFFGIFLLNIETENLALSAITKTIIASSSSSSDPHSV